MELFSSGTVIGVDVGGTKVAVAPVDRTGRMVAEPLIEPTATSGTDAFIEGLRTTLGRALEQFSSFSPGAIGIACAGTVDAEHRHVVKSPNLPLDNFPLAEALQSALGLEVVLENDANAALLAEVTVGAASGLKHVVMLTLGTGVGGGILTDGRLYRGAGGGAAELGHVIVCGGGELCTCGSYGCLEMYASGRALARFAKGNAGDQTYDPQGLLAKLEEDGDLEGEEVGRLIKQGYPGALVAAGELAMWLGRGIIGLVNTFNPQMVVIGGGVSEVGEAIIAPARETVQTYAMSPNRDEVQIVAAKLGNEAGLVGGALTVWRLVAAREEPKCPPVVGGSE